MPASMATYQLSPWGSIFKWFHWPLGHQKQGCSIGSSHSAKAAYQLRPTIHSIKSIQGNPQFLPIFLTPWEFEDGPRNGKSSPGYPHQYLYREVRLLSKPCKLSWGKFQGEPATNQLDWSFAPMLGYDERFARQYRYRLPPGFPLASPYPSIARWFSGRNLVARAQSNSATEKNHHINSPWGHTNPVAMIVEKKVAFLSPLFPENPVGKTGYSGAPVCRTCISFSTNSFMTIFPQLRVNDWVCGRPP